MISFRNDYGEGCHPRILEAMIRTNAEPQEGYCEDIYSDEARAIIRKKTENENTDIHFVSGGTQANLTVIASLLRPFESVISAATGHVNIHEAGAIEATGHKIEYALSPDGKLTVEMIRNILLTNEDHHMTKPRLVYVSNATELGTVYRKKELEDIFSFCKSADLILYLDGARIGSALCSEKNDLTFPDIAKLTDVFFIGGTKNGALLGEAIVIVKDALKKDFIYNVKQRGGLLAKGRILGLQFTELLRDDLYFELARHANAMARKMSDALRSKGYTFIAEPESNVLFPVLPNSLIEKLSAEFGFYRWKIVDDTHTSIRLVTSWATQEGDVDSFLRHLD